MPQSCTTKRLSRRITLTHAGLVADEGARRFWPAWVVVLLGLGAWLMGWVGLSEFVRWPGLVWSGAFLVLVGWGAWGMRVPTRREAETLVDQTIPGRPMAALADRPAPTGGIPETLVIWEAFQARMAEQLNQLQTVWPDLRLSHLDVFGLRYVALGLVVLGLLFGGGSRTPKPVGGASEGLSIASGPAWEGWLQPPLYTRKPTLYLADLKTPRIQIPQGSTVSLRFYGAKAENGLRESVSGSDARPEAVRHEFVALQDGELEVTGPNGRIWSVDVAGDIAPEVRLSGPLTLGQKGVFFQPFHASDDYGIATGEARFMLDLSQVARTFGLMVEPDPIGPAIVDLPLPFSGNRAAFDGELEEDLSTHILANLPVVMVLSVDDGAGQTGVTEPVNVTLPGRRFFHPAAAAVIEIRRDLLWSAANGPRALQLLRAVAYRSEDYLRSDEARKQIVDAIEALIPLVDRGIAQAEKPQIAADLWALALELEEGALSDARERMRRAQQRLEEAMRNGATPEDIEELMQELRDATQDYLQLLAEERGVEQRESDMPDQGDAETLSNDQIQEMLDEIQQLMEAGRMEEAMALLEMLNQLLESLQFQEGQGEGQPMPGQEALEGLSDTLRDQQELSDDAYRELQERFNQRPGQSGQQGGAENSQPSEREGSGLGVGENGGSGAENDQGPGTEGTFEQRQEALRRELKRQRQGLPRLEGPPAGAAEEALDRAEGAMRRAEDALRDGDIPEALDQQSQALDALRDGLRNLGEAMRRDQDQASNREGQEGGTARQSGQSRRSDPLGRSLGDGGRAGTEDSLLSDEEIRRRADELLDDLRRRSGELSRPEAERDYFNRLLEQF